MNSFLVGNRCLHIHFASVHINICNGQVYSLFRIVLTQLCVKWYVRPDVPAKTQGNSIVGQPRCSNPIVNPADWPAVKPVGFNTTWSVR